VRERLLAGDLDDVRVVIESLADEFDVVDIAAAAIKLLHASTAGDGSEDEIPAIAPAAASGSGTRLRERERHRPAPGARPRRPGPGEPGRPGGSENIVRLFVGAGRKAGVRPGDLVGAITGEAGVTSRDLGAIEIADGFSLVEVPESIADHVIEALRGSAIRGKKVTVRRDRG
jgi:ATP-dependent RNA helicase DeaD